MPKLSLPTQHQNRSRAIKHLTKSQQSELLDLLDCYSECFTDVPGYSNVISHSITLKEGFRPKRLPAYRVPERLKPMVDRQIQEILDNNIVRPSSSPMTSPLVCTLKGKDGLTVFVWLSMIAT